MKWQLKEVLESLVGQKIKKITIATQDSGDRLLLEIEESNVRKEVEFVVTDCRAKITTVETL